MTYRSLQNDGAWNEAENWMQLEMRIRQEQNMKEQARQQQGTPDSPTKKSRTSPREVATGTVHLKPPCSSYIQAGGLTLTAAPGPTSSSGSSTSSEERSKRKTWAAAVRVW